MLLSHPAAQTSQDVRPKHVWSSNGEETLGAALGSTERLGQWPHAVQGQLPILNLLTMPVLFFCYFKKKKLHHCLFFTQWLFIQDIFDEHNKHVQKNGRLLFGGDSGRSEVRVGQPEGVEWRVASVVPQQLLLQEAHGVQREHDGLVFQQAVDIQAWGKRGGKTRSGSVELKEKTTLLLCKLDSTARTIFSSLNENK